MPCSRTAGAPLGREERYQRGRQYLGVNVVLLSVENLMLGTWDRPRQGLGARAWRRFRFRSLLACFANTPPGPASYPLWFLNLPLYYSRYIVLVDMGRTSCRSSRGLAAESSGHAVCFPLNAKRGIMPTRAEILDTLAASQTQVLAFFHGLSAEDLVRPATASDLPGAAPWRAKDHLAHLVQNERNIQQLLRRALAGEPRDAFLRSQYPEGMPLPGTLGDPSALTAEEEERMTLAIAQINQAVVNARHDDTLETLTADFQAERQDTLDLLRQFTDEQLAASIPTVVGDQAVGNFFAGRADHATEHITSIEGGLRQSV